MSRAHAHWHRFRGPTVAVLLACLPLLHCAYLNTFYNARTSYNSARREHQKLARTHPDSLETLPQSISDKYDRAISKSLKVLEAYPKSKKWHDDAVYMTGRAAYYKKEYASAIRRLRRLQREFPKSPFIPESYLYLGRAYLGNDNLLKAEETFRFVIEKYPALNSNEEVSMLLAQVAIQREGKAEAIALLEQTLESVKAPERKMEIRLKIARLYMALRQYEKAVSVLKEVPRKKNFPDYLYRTDFALLACYAELGRYDDALRLADGMLKSRQYVTHYPEIRLKKAKVLKKADRGRDAMEAFEEITKNTTSDPDIQGEAWLELGYIFQHERGNFEKARECYEKAVTLLKNEQLREVAETRKRAIDRLTAYRMRLSGEIAVKDTSDTTDTAATVAIDTTAPLRVVRYRMGEIFWLSLEEPDSALEHFDAIGDDSVAADTLQAQALYARAWITLHMKQDSSSADSLFGVLIDRCPATPFAKQSQSEMGLPVTIMTRGDSAHEAFVKAEEVYTRDGNALGASKAYLRVAKAYPDEVGAKSMYAAAWLCDNELHKNVTARKLYRMVCDSFPQSDLCLNEAKPRLQVVEDTLEAIRARKEAGGAGRGASNKQERGAAKRKKKTAKAAVEESGDPAVRDDEEAANREPDGGGEQSRAAAQPAEAASGPAPAAAVPQTLPPDNRPEMDDIQ